MIHNFKLTVRQLAKNKLYSFLGIAGFAFGFAVCLVIGLFIQFELTMDRCFDNHSRIYRLNDAGHSVHMVYKDKDIYIENYPEIELVCPVEYHAGWSRPVFTGEKSVYIQNSITTDSTFFEVFTIPILKSTARNPLEHPSSAVITESCANILFGDKDPLNQEITFDNDKLLMVSAIIPDFPENASLHADILLSAENELIRGSYTGDGNNGWNYSVNFYALLVESASPLLLEQKMKNTLKQLGAAVPNVRLQALDQSYLDQPLEGDGNKTGNPALIILFGTIGLLILVLSMINHINFILSLQLKKLKEIGIKKTSGAGLMQLLTHYFVEIAVWIFLSLAFALVLVQIVLPYANRLLDRPLNFMTIFTTPFCVYVALSLLLVLSLSALAYLVLLSRFDYKSYFSGHLGSGHKDHAKKALTIFQFAISVFLLVAVFAIQEQIRYVKHRDVGFNKDHLLMLKFPYRYKHGQTLQARLTNHTSIVSTSLSMGNPGNIKYGTMGRGADGNNFNMSRIDVDLNFLETFEIPLVQGRAFLPGEGSKVCLINETAVKNYGWDTLDGKTFAEFPVVGVVQDFHISSMRHPIEGVGLVLNNEQQPSTLNLRIQRENISATMEFIRQTWDSVSPQTPFEYQFYDDWYDSLYRGEERFTAGIRLFALIAFLITCLGLLGQTIHICLNRTKEIGIRKVVGATVPSILLLLTKQFAGWVLVANVIAWPVAWYVVNMWLHSFAYRTELTLWPFILAGLAALLIAVLTVSWQAIRAATANPVEALRYE
ncbi:ABC transporter permease [candidate division KSB1 bacterium]|nr:ABC transporter permease [candidate division KSB1 bacterium]